MNRMHTRLGPAIALALAAPMLVACAPPAAQHRHHQPPPQTYHSPTQNCQQCGVVQSIQLVETEGGTTAGTVAGAVAGGLIGSQVGGGRGRTAATAAGAVGGGLAGREIQRRAGAGTTYEIVVRMDDGRTQVVRQNDLGNVREGTAVLVRGDHVVAR